MKPGYWKASDFLRDTFYRIIEDEGRLKLDYITFNRVGGSTAGVFYLKDTDHWTVPVEEVTEKEYFVARLRGRP
jgi:hypothetical protein